MVRYPDAMLTFTAKELQTSCQQWRRPKIMKKLRTGADDSANRGISKPPLAPIDTDQLSLRRGSARILTRSIANDDLTPLRGPADGIAIASAESAMG
jgi:hypothetical protein